VTVTGSVTEANKAVVNGTATEFSVALFCNNVKCGSAFVTAQGTFSVQSSYLNSGTTQLSVTATSKSGLTSEPVIIAEPAVILPPPVFTAISLNFTRLTVVGTSAANALIRFMNLTATVTAQNDWSFPPMRLAAGTYNLTATAEDANGVSDMALGGPITVELLEPPIVTNTELNASNFAIVKGTGDPGATIELYSGGAKVGTTIVLEDGSFSVSTTSALSTGLYVLELKQISTSLDVESALIAAGMVEVKTPITTSPATSSTSTATTASSTTFTVTTSVSTTTTCDASVGGRFPFVVGTAPFGVNDRIGIAVDNSENVYAYGDFYGRNSSQTFTIQCSSFPGTSTAEDLDFSANPFLMK